MRSACLRQSLKKLRLVQFCSDFFWPHRSLFLSAPPQKNMAQKKKRIWTLYDMSFPRVAFCVFRLGLKRKGEDILFDLLPPHWGPGISSLPPSSVSSVHPKVCWTSRIPWRTKIPLKKGPHSTQTDLSFRSGKQMGKGYFRWWKKKGKCWC